MYQRAYIARRRPGTTREAFQRRWRTHFEVALGMHGFWPPVTRYVQADVFDEGLEAFQTSPLALTRSESPSTPIERRVTRR